MADEERPDPDELLSRIAAEQTEEEAKSNRGKLKIFFGACAGVGKTYAMLSAGQQALKEGVDVVIGIVETHGRGDTEKLAQGMPLLPLKEIQYRGTQIKEFDIDAALARKPQLIIIDELAHTNAPGSRHPKRSQDIEELLNAGIDVYTTVNVQHLESLNDVVARITGIWVKETIPDSFFDAADEISLIDIPSEELLKRLKEGKVYIAPGAKRRAAQNFFRKENLIALRELALRRTAERVDALMDSYKSRTGTLQGWSGGDKILVCIGADQLSSKLVRVAKRTASSLKAPWTAIYIENDRHYRLSPEGQLEVQRTLRLAERMGGKVETIVGGTAVDEVLNYARLHGFNKIIVGKRPRARWREVLYGTLADNIIRRSGEIDVYVVTGEREQKTLLLPFWRSTGHISYYLAAPIATTISTLLMFPLRNLVEPITLAAGYLIAVAVVAVQYGRGPVVLTTLLSAAAYKYFFLAPFYSFYMENTEGVFMFVTLVLSGIIIGTQTSRLRLQATSSKKREENTIALYDMTKELSASRGKNTLAEIVSRHIGEVLDSDVSVWIPGEDDKLNYIVEYDEGEEDLDLVREESAARWALTHKQTAGLGTETLPSASGFYIPISNASTVLGVIGVIPHDERKSYNAEDIDLLDTFANITATALERANAAELVEKTLVETESEKLRNILLSSVSHDLRTPLASITGAASTLLIESPKITDEYKGELLRLIHEEAARLARIVTNLLDVTSLEAGSVKLNKEHYFIEELIGSALMRMEHRLKNRTVHTRIEHGLPLVRMDGLLIEQVLINVLDNVADHTPENTHVEIEAVLDKPDIHVIISDNGPGIPAGEEERIFDKFYKGRDNAHDRVGKDGGLGLAICRGIIKAHGGKIWAQNSPTGGSIFTFTLPVRSYDVEEM